MSLMNDRIQSAKRLLAKASLMTVTIDDYEQSKLTELLSAIFGQENQLGIIAIRINPKGRMTARKTSLVHEYAIIYGNSYLSTVKNYLKILLRRLTTIKKISTVPGFCLLT